MFRVSIDSRLTFYLFLCSNLHSDRIKDLLTQNLIQFNLFCTRSYENFVFLEEE